MLTTRQRIVRRRACGHAHFLHIAARHWGPPVKTVLVLPRALARPQRHAKERVIASASAWHACEASPAAPSPPVLGEWQLPQMPRKSFSVSERLLQREEEDASEYRRLEWQYSGDAEIARAPFKSKGRGS
ncbi:hypothetical protein ERJ75_000450600 [Trypanosoma vivax]|nr:hypothetical protein ERJ75_001312400 [Trypanosoma vivax]KAH8608408.1 hypothetical protein ERJ75_001312000 [Trypanosoma vivax]KAH8608416.1 hypothetical protein ERJ75_001311800 [Trypanosoma vivax]KAH8616719.1 hypothetical protein ERJ75_000450800 [Trypanosoma vivax]KAH8616722.1 hypothetical protein ERJ75_000450600 [Trypanosoma vivax]